MGKPLLKTSSYDDKLNILFAYPYFSNSVYGILQEMSNYRLIIDSGAFSAFNCGEVIELKEYQRFLKRISYEKYEAAVQLDVVFNPQKTKENYARMIGDGFNVCPVFTRGADFDYFQKLLESDSYVFVGGVQGGVSALPFAKKCLDLSFGKKVHYLAFIRSGWLNHYKPFSTDASTWSSSCRFGSLFVYAGHGKMVKLERKHFINKPDHTVILMLKKLGMDDSIIKRLGMSHSWEAKKFTDINDQNTSNLNTFISICSYIKYSIDAQNKIGTRIYAALPNDIYLRLFNYAYLFLKHRRVI